MDKKYWIVPVKVGTVESLQNATQFLVLDIEDQKQTFAQSFIKLHREMFREFLLEHRAIKCKRCKTISFRSTNTCALCKSKHCVPTKTKTKFTKHKIVTEEFSSQIVNYCLGVADGSSEAISCFLCWDFLNGIVPILPQSKVISTLTNYEILAEICVLSPETSRFEEISYYLHDSHETEIISELKKEFALLEAEKNKMKS